jgi:hypothetical protein
MCSCLTRCLVIHLFRGWRHSVRAWYQSVKSLPRRIATLGTRVRPVERSERRGEVKHGRFEQRSRNARLTQPGHTQRECHSEGAQRRRNLAPHAGGAGFLASLGMTERVCGMVCGTAVSAVGVREVVRTRYSPWLSTLGHVQNRFRSPQTLSMRPTGGQNLYVFRPAAG